MRYRDSSGTSHGPPLPNDVSECRWALPVDCHCDTCTGLDLPASRWRCRLRRRSGTTDPPARGEGLIDGGAPQCASFPRLRWTPLASPTAAIGQLKERTDGSYRTW